MKFTPASQNGVVPATLPKTKNSKFGIIVSSTSSLKGQPLIIKALSDAAMHKTRPVTFYDGTTTNVIGTASFIDAVSAPLVLNNLAVGSHSIFASWPGEGTYKGVTTELQPLAITIIDGYDLGGSLTVTSSPSSGSLVVGEGTATFTATMSTSYPVPGNILFYNNHRQIGSVPVFHNKATLKTDQLPAGDLVITAAWPSGIINGQQFAGQSQDINYTVLRGSTLGGSLNLTVNPQQPIYQEGTITLTGQLTSSTQVGGNIIFYKDGVQLYSSPVINNSSTYTFLNRDPVGTYTYTAEWDGNQSSHPRYIEIYSGSVTAPVMARANPGPLTYSITPNPSAYTGRTQFTATFTTSTIIQGSVNFYYGNYLIGQSSIINNVATYTTSTLLTGTYTSYAYYTGSSVEPKFYSTYSNTLTLTVNPGFEVGAPIFVNVTNDSYQGIRTPYVKGENQTVTAQISTSLQLTDVVDFYIQGPNGTQDLYAPWNSNTATTTTQFAVAGTYTIQAQWFGNQIGEHYYVSTSSTVTSITVLDGYTMTRPITLSESLIRVIQEPITITASISTSSAMTGTVQFFANNALIGLSQFNSLTNQAVFTTTSLVNSGTYSLGAYWTGGYIDDHRLYLGKFANTGSIYVDAAQHVNSLIVSADTNNLYATISAHDNFNGANRGNITFYDLLQVPTYHTSVSTSTSTVVNFAGTTTMVVTGVTLPITHYSSGQHFWILDSYPKIKVNYIESNTFQIGQFIEFWNDSVSGGVLGIQPLRTGAKLKIMSIDLSNKEIALADPSYNTNLGSQIVNYGNPNYETAVNLIDLNNSYPYKIIDVSKIQGHYYGASFVVVNTYTYSIQTTTSITTSISYTSYGTSILGTVTNWSNNVATLPIPLNKLGVGLNYITASYGGTGVIPKYYPYNNSVYSILTITQAQIIANPVSFYQHSEDGSTINSVAYAPITVIGSAPTGTAKLYDGANLLSTIDIASTSIFSWIPSQFNQIDSGTRTLTVQYLGDRYNSTATISTSFIASTRRNISLYVSINAPSYSIISTGTYYKSTNFQIKAEFPSNYFNGKTINFYESNTLLGSANVEGYTATLQLNTFNLSAGSHNISARYNGDFAYNPTVSNTISYNLNANGYVPLTVEFGDPTLRIPLSGYTTNTNIGSTLEVPSRVDFGEYLGSNTNQSFVFTIPERANSPLTINIVQYLGEFINNSHLWQVIWGSTVTSVLLTGTSVSLPNPVDFNNFTLSVINGDKAYQARITGTNYVESRGPVWDINFYNPDPDPNQ